MCSVSFNLSVTKSYGIHLRALIVKIQENTNKCTILQYTVFILKVLEL